MANETLEIEIVCDGITEVATQAAVAGSFYQVVYSLDPSTALRYACTIADATAHLLRVEGHNLRVRMRKTTATGAGDFYSKVVYSMV